jgi:hypothetical protein
MVESDVVLGDVLELDVVEGGGFPVVVRDV